VKHRLVHLLVCVCLSIMMLGITAVAAPREKNVKKADDLKTTQVKTHEVIKTPLEIPVGIFVTSIYGLNFAGERYSVVFWVWATYHPQQIKAVTTGGHDYVFLDHIEIVNAQERKLSPTEQYIVNHPDGSQYVIGKFAATLNQNWDVSHFPFDKQILRIVIESVELDSKVLKFVPDVKNSLVSNDFSLNGWRISPLQLESLIYQYPTTFGIEDSTKGMFSRLVVEIPIERNGLRLFLTIFLGFFISYVIIITLTMLDKEMLSNKISLIMTALFATVGNKHIIDSYFPTQTAFSLSDLVQVTTFIIVTMGLINTVIVIKLIKNGKETLATRLDYLAFILIAPTYPIVIATGVYFALTGNLKILQ